MKTRSVKAPRQKGGRHVPGTSGGRCDRCSGPWRRRREAEGVSGGQSRQGLWFVVPNVDVILRVKANFCRVLN